MPARLGSTVQWLHTHRGPAPKPLSLAICTICALRLPLFWTCRKNTTRYLVFPHTIIELSSVAESLSSTGLSCHLSLLSGTVSRNFPVIFFFWGPLCVDNIISYRPITTIFPTIFHLNTSHQYQLTISMLQSPPRLNRHGATSAKSSSRHD